MNLNDKDDLYGDLDLTLDKNDSGRGDQSKSCKKQKTGDTGHCKKAHSASRFASAIKSSEEKEAVLLKEVELLKQENLRLKRNIGTLFRTAKNEIQRKDYQIERLQNQLDKQS